MFVDLPLFMTSVHSSGHQSKKFMAGLWGAYVEAGFVTKAVSSYIKLRGLGGQWYE